jgi:Nuclease-related domain
VTAILLIAAVAVAYWYYRRPSRRTGPGASAAARARALRTPWVRLTTALGIPTRGARQAARWQAGATGEQRTADRLAPLLGEGWTVLHDRALPRSRANVDHLAISPTGVVILPDTKRWSARYRLRLVNGRLLHGTHDVTSRLDGLHHEAAAVSRLLGVPVIPLVVMDGPPVDGELNLDGVRIVPADRALNVLRTLGRTPAQHPPAGLPARAAHLLPPYREGSR